MNKSSPVNEYFLTAQVELFYYLAVALDVVFFEVSEQTAAFADHLHQPVARMNVLLVDLQVLGNTLNSLGEKSNLHLWRACVALVKGKLLDNSFLFLACEQLSHPFLFNYPLYPSRRRGIRTAQIRLVKF